MAARRPIALLLCGLLPAALLAGCSGGRTSSARHGARPSTAVSDGATTAPASPAVADPRAPSAARTPDLSALGVDVVVSGKALTGQRAYAIPRRGTAAAALAVAVDCQGPGKVLVTLEPRGISIPLNCEKKVVPTLNEIELAENGHSASIGFVPTGDVTWSFAAGWDANPPDRA
ncbi:hypothetical protein ACFYRN_01680 [Streptomyces sp. NPDC005227]|uniref:hypothetical protein n=1 Tax=Streptomyces sp. NPDC005227 TaxID=3364707 RepID=UPI0036BE068B